MKTAYDIIMKPIITEQSMASDVLKADLLLYQLQLFKILFLQRQTHPAGSHTVVHLIVEFRIPFRRQQNPFFFHLNNPAFLFQSLRDGSKDLSLNVHALAGE